MTPDERTVAALERIAWALEGIYNLMGEQRDEARRALVAEQELLRRRMFEAASRFESYERSALEPAIRRDDEWRARHRQAEQDAIAAHDALTAFEMAHPELVRTEARDAVA